MTRHNVFMFLTRTNKTPATVPELAASCAALVAKRWVEYLQ
jgi:hypothetical protein